MLELQAIDTYRGRAQILRQLSLTVGESPRTGGRASASAMRPRTAGCFPT